MPPKSEATVVGNPHTNHSTDLVSSLPAPIVRVLVIFSHPIRSVRIALEILSWKPDRRVESWMVVGGWWLVCMGAGHGFKYLLPIAVFLPLSPISIDTLRLPQLATTVGLKSRALPPSTPAQPSTQESLLLTLSDLHAIDALIPPSPAPRVERVYSRFKALGSLRLARGLIVLWVVWVVLGRMIGYRALLALIGTALILLPSPALAQLVHHLSKSLVARRTLALFFLVAFGSPPEQSIKFDLQFSVRNWVRSKWAASRRPSLAFAFKPATLSPDTKVEENAIVDEEQEEPAGEPIYFRFEVHENQRWWMGLDWTSALIPQERPSWCDSHLLPASPPPSFTLPTPSFIVLPSPTPSDPNSKVRRTATWKWLDDDWSVVRAGPGLTSSASSHALSPNPSTDDRPSSPTKPSSRPSSGLFGTSPSDDPSSTSFGSATSASVRAQSIAEQAFTKGLERLKRTTAPSATVKSPASPRASIDTQRDRRASQTSDDLSAIDEGSVTPHGGGPAVGSGAALSMIGGGEMIVERDDATDNEGWVYGDNKWENMGAKGGLGKFTRRRRWQRRAICVETVQRLPSSPLPLSSTLPSKSDDPHATPVASKKTPLPSTQTDTEPAITRGGQTLSPTRSAGVEGESRGRTGRADSSGTGAGGEVVRGASVTGRVDDMGSIIPPAGQTRTEQSRDDVLRQRLKKAMGNVGG